MGVYALSQEAEQVRSMELAARHEMLSLLHVPSGALAVSQASVVRLQKEVKEVATTEVQPMQPVPHPILPDALSLERDYWLAVEKPPGHAEPRVEPPKRMKKVRKEERAPRMPNVGEYLATWCARGATVKELATR